MRREYWQPIVTAIGVTAAIVAFLAWFGGLTAETDDIQRLVRILAVFTGIATVGFFIRPESYGILQLFAALAMALSTAMYGVFLHTSNGWGFGGSLLIMFIGLIMVERRLHRFGVIEDPSKPNDEPPEGLSPKTALMAILISLGVETFILCQLLFP